MIRVRRMWTRFQEESSLPGYLKMTIRFTMTMRVRIKTRTQTTFPRAMMVKMKTWRRFPGRVRLAS